MAKAKVRSSAWKAANLNDTVRFKLTVSGLSYVRYLNLHDIVFSRYPLVVTADKSGWSELELWRFASIFGRALTACASPVVEMRIMLRR